MSGELAGLSDGIKSLIGTEHAVLNAAAKYFFELDGGKKIRPTMASIYKGGAWLRHRTTRFVDPLLVATGIDNVVVEHRVCQRVLLPCGRTRLGGQRVASTGIVVLQG